MDTENKKIKSFKDLIVWQRAMQLVDSVYDISEGFPKAEQFSLTSQMRRSAISIPSNIAEGSLRFSQKEYKHFLDISLGSNAELWTQIEIAYRRKFINEDEYLKMSGYCEEISKMLHKIIINLKSKF